MKLNLSWPEHVRRFLTRYEQGWADPASGRLAEMWHDDAVMTHPELTEPMVGRDAILDYLEPFLAMAPDLTNRPLSAAADGDVLFVHFEMNGTFGGTPVTVQGVDRFELEGDRAARGDGFFDTTPIRRALGVGV